jgi:putative glycosyltransferase (TIGR04372 family)
MIFNLIKKHTNDIKKRGIVALIIKGYRLIQFFLLSLSIFFSLPIIFIIKLINPIFTIRFGKLMSSRIGHFTANTELYLCEKEEKINIPQNKNYIDIFFLGHKPVCNEQLLKMWKRKIIIFPKVLIEPLFIANKLLPNKIRNEVPENIHGDRDINNLINKHSPHCFFTDDEEKYGLKMLNKMGLKNNEKFVCLIVRDDAYLDKTFKNGDWNYHNYRDCNIDNYKLVSEYLANQGYFVFRMGSIVKEKFVSNNTRIIDYATNGFRNDFLDIYLGAKCHFCISSSLGWDAIPEIFKRPIVYTNILPLGYLRLHSYKAINLSKHFVRKDKNIELSLNQIFTENLALLLSSDEYKKNDILLIENSPQEILDAVLDMIELIKNNFILNEKQTLLRNKFLEIFPDKVLDNYQKQPLHGTINGNYSFTFLKNNPQWLD